MRVVSPRQALVMTDDEVIAAAAAEGFELGWRFVGEKLLVGFTRGDDTRYRRRVCSPRSLRWTIVGVPFVQ